MGQLATFCLNLFPIPVKFCHSEQSVSILRTINSGDQNMARAVIDGSIIEDGILNLVRDEREKALSAREWKFRLKGYGYAIKDVSGALVLTSLPQGVELGVLPTDMA
jgi:hypothetical protein